MNVLKIGHCCLLIEANLTKILTDPGVFTTKQDTYTGIDAVIITHEHADHCHVPSLQNIIKNNPNVVVYANTATAQLLGQAGIPHTIIQEGSVLQIKNIQVQTWNCDHAEIYKDMQPVLNTALLIDNKLFYPGDAFYNTHLPVHTLALPISAPWCKTSEVIEYVNTINPRQCFPIHDGVLDVTNGSPYYGLLKKFIYSTIQFKNLKAGESLEL